MTSSSSASLSALPSHPLGGIGGALPFLLGNALLGSIGIFVHASQAGPATVTWFRCAFGLVGLTLWLAWRSQLRGLRLAWAQWPWVLLVSALMLLGWWLFFTAIQWIPTGMGVVLFHVQPLWVLLLGAWWLKEAVPRRRVLSVLLAMAGLALATGVAQGGAPAAGSGYWLGVGLCLVGALCTAGVTVVARRLQGLPVGVLAWWQCAVGAAVLWAGPMEQGWPPWGAPWAWLAGLGLLHTGLAYTLIYAGMARMATARVAVLQFTYPVVAILIDAAYFQQPLGAVQLAGVALMLGAITLGERSMAPRPAQ